MSSSEILKLHQAIYTRKFQFSTVKINFSETVYLITIVTLGADLGNMTSNAKRHVITYI